MQGSGASRCKARANPRFSWAGASLHTCSMFPTGAFGHWPPASTRASRPLWEAKFGFPHAYADMYVHSKAHTPGTRVGWISSPGQTPVPPHAGHTLSHSPLPRLEF